MIITCAIIDDEPLAAGLLESYTKRTPYLELKGSYNSAILAMKDLRENPVQLLFLDVQMPELLSPMRISCFLQTRRLSGLL